MRGSDACYRLSSHEARGVAIACKRVHRPVLWTSTVSVGWPVEESIAYRHEVLPRAKGRTRPATATIERSRSVTYSAFRELYDTEAFDRVGGYAIAWGRLYNGERGSTHGRGGDRTPRRSADNFINTSEKPPAKPVQATNAPCRHTRDVRTTRILRNRSAKTF